MLPFFLLALAMGLAVGGDSDDDDEVGSIAEFATNNPGFSTLDIASKAVDLDSVLDDSNGTFNVFAPNNSAFTKVDSIERNNLLTDIDRLKEVLLYHVIAGREIDSDAAIVPAGTSQETANTAKDKIAI